MNIIFFIFFGGGIYIDRMSYKGLFGEHINSAEMNKPTSPAHEGNMVNQCLSRH